VLGGVDNTKASNNKQRFNFMKFVFGKFKKAETTNTSDTQNQTQLDTQQSMPWDTTQNQTQLDTQKPTSLVVENNQTPDVNFDTLKFQDKDPIPTNIKFYKIFGLGCDISIERNFQAALSYQNAKKYISEQKKIAKMVKCNTDDVTIVCNSFIDPISNIISLWFSKMLTYGLLSKNLNNLENTNEFKNLLNSVTFYLNKGSLDNDNIKKVYVHGHSFGGAMANQLAIVLQNKANLDKDFMEKMKSKLVIRTFGSIFIPPFNSIKDVNITNYLALNDVAQRLNFQTEPKPNEITKPYNTGISIVEQKTFLINDKEIINKSIGEEIGWEKVEKHNNILVKTNISETYLIKRNFSFYKIIKKEDLNNDDKSIIKNLNSKNFKKITFEYSYNTASNFYIKIKPKENNDSVVWIDHYAYSDYKTRGINELFSKNAPYQERGWDINIPGNNYEWRIHTAYGELERKLMRDETPVYVT
jgi:hypothetical protein